MEVYKACLIPNTVLDSTQSLAWRVWPLWGNAAPGWAMILQRRFKDQQGAWMRRPYVLEILLPCFFKLQHKQNCQHNIPFFFRYFRLIPLGVLMYEGVVKMRVLVAMSAFATHLSEGSPVGQNLWVYLLKITVCFIAYKQSICWLFIVEPVPIWPGLASALVSTPYCDEVDCLLLNQQVGCQ